jgi:hypothetical protein
LVVKGKFKGRVGYYDDDEDDLAVVYFGRPFDAGYELIPRGSLVRTAVTPLELERWKRDHPEIAKLIGVK